MRWWERLFYAHDPEARRLAALNRELLDRLHARFSTLEGHLGLRSSGTAPAPIRLDCGHEDVSYAQDKDGVTWCRPCYQRKVALGPEP